MNVLVNHIRTAVPNTMSVHNLRVLVGYNLVLRLRSMKRNEKERSSYAILTMFFFF